MVTAAEGNTTGFAKLISSALITASYVLGIASLFLPAFSSNGSFLGYVAFLAGPFWIFFGHYSWLANPLLILSWVKFGKKQYRGALIAGILSILLGSTFLLYDKIFMIEYFSSYRVMSGYYIWLIGISYASIASFLRQNLSKYGALIQRISMCGVVRLEKFHVLFIILTGVPLLIATIPKIVEEHLADRAFSRVCISANEVIVRVPENVKGVFLDHTFSATYFSIFNNKYSGSASSSIGEKLMNMELVEFYEVRNLVAAHEAKAPYLRHTKFNEELPTQKLASLYGLYRTPIVDSEAEKFGIEGFEVYILDLKSKEVTARFRYFHHPNTGRVCGPIDNGEIDEFRFMMRALGLKDVRSKAE
jgi:hypothetical protein